MTIRYQLVRIMKKFFYPKETTDELLTDKSTIEIQKSQITDFPSSMPPTSHTHTKNQISDFAHTHTRNQISDFSHTHTKNQISDFAHTHTRNQISDFSHSHTTNDISNFPETMPPSAHTHTKNQISDFAHTHTKNQISDFTHNHDDRYFTESEINTKLNAKANSSHNQNASTIISPTSYQYIGSEQYDTQEAINQAINTKFMKIDEGLFEKPATYREFNENNGISSSILKEHSVLTFFNIGDFVFVEYSIKGQNNSATNELLVTNYLDEKYRPFYSSKYFDLSPHRNDCTPIRLEITEKGHVGVTPLQAKPIASYGSFFYLKHLPSYVS